MEDLFSRLNKPQPTSPLSTCQATALEALEDAHALGGNVFLTGAAGTGKSWLLRQFLRDKDPKKIPILASTGAAAILVGGRTFHSFFGLGILEGGVAATVERATGNKRVVRRMKNTNSVVIDEVSMLSGSVLRAAEAIARESRGSHEPWGGLRIIAVGDFAQLPPVNPHSRLKDWAFLDPVWELSRFRSVQLHEIQRTSERRFLEVLNRIRHGQVDAEVAAFLRERTLPPPDPEVTRLLARREDVERHNLERLGRLQSEPHTFTTQYVGRESDLEMFRKNAPIPESITLKEGALVMLRQNDPAGRWVNGSLGHVERIEERTLQIELLTGRLIALERADFTMLDAEGTPVASANNFPVSLAWAITIHKSQGTSLDRVQVDLRRLWEPGQAYVALSRARNPEELYLEGWSPASIITDPAVSAFYSRIPSL